jgi:hypothetical protein
MRLSIALALALVVAAAAPVFASDKSGAVHIRRTHSERFAQAKALAPMTTLIPVRAGDDDGFELQSRRLQPGLQRYLVFP